MARHPMARRPMADVVIRTSTPADQGELAALILAGMAEHWGEVDESLNPDLVDLAAAYPGGRTIVVEHGGRIVGTGTVHPTAERTAEVRRMSVESGARRLGVGRAIVTELLATARAWGCERVVLETSAHWDDVVAFYVGCGFTITHHEDGPYGRDTWFELVL